MAPPRIRAKRVCLSVTRGGLLFASCPTLIADIPCSVPTQLTDYTFFMTERYFPDAWLWDFQ